MSSKHFSLVNISIGIVIVYWAFYFSIYYTTAPVEDIKAVTSMTDGHPIAQHKLQEFLNQHPIPKIGELSDIKEQINEQIALDMSRQLTGNTKLGNQSAATDPNIMNVGKEQNERATLLSRKFAELPFGDMLRFTLYKINDYAPAVFTIVLILWIGLGFMWKRD